MKQQQHKTATRKTPMGSKYNTVVPKMEDKHNRLKTKVILFENKNKKAPKLKSQ